MSIPRRLARFLDPRIPYATEVELDAAGSRGAGSSSRPCDAFVKPVIMSVDGRIVMAVIPFSESVDIDRLQQCLGTPDVHLAAQSEFRHLVTDCDAGAMPIFGSIYGIPVLVAHELTDNEEIAFRAGTLRDVVRVRVRDFLITEKPCICAREAILARAS